MMMVNVIIDFAAMATAAAAAGGSSSYPAIAIVDVIIICGSIDDSRHGVGVD